jgi:hypothetical protein
MRRSFPQLPPYGGLADHAEQSRLRGSAIAGARSRQVRIEGGN